MGAADGGEIEDSIRIVPYDPAWPGMFEAEAGRLREALGPLALRIDHVGSTAVPGLAAKPVIDIQISVRPLHPFDAWRPALERSGYSYYRVEGYDDYPYFYRPPEMPHTHHIHVCEAGGLHERRHLAFRDALRADAALAGRYEALKRELARRHSAATHESRNAYADAKSEFIQSVCQARGGETPGGPA